MIRREVCSNATIASRETVAVASKVRVKQDAPTNCAVCLSPIPWRARMGGWEAFPGGYGSCPYRSATASDCPSAESSRAEIQEVPSGTESRAPCEQTLIPLLGVLPGRASGVRKLAAGHSRLPTSRWASITAALSWMRARPVCRSRPPTAWPRKISFGWPYNSTLPLIP
jgi:hypothetical protein